MTLSVISIKMYMSREMDNGSKLCDLQSVGTVMEEEGRHYAILFYLLETQKLLGDEITRVHVHYDTQYKV